MGNNFRRRSNSSVASAVLTAAMAFGGFKAHAQPHSINSGAVSSSPAEITLDFYGD